MLEVSYDENLGQWSQLEIRLNPLSTNSKKWSNILFDGKLPANCLSVFNHFVGLALKWLIPFVGQPVCKKRTHHSFIRSEGFATFSAQ